MFARLANIATRLVKKFGARFPKTSKITEPQSDNTVVQLVVNEELPQHACDTINEVARVVVPALADAGVMWFTSEYSLTGSALVSDDETVVKRVILANTFNALRVEIDPLSLVVTLVWVSTEGSVEARIVNGSFSYASRQKITKFLTPSTLPAHQS